MQLKNQNGKQRDWKVVAAITAASAIGLSGLALANPGDGSDAPDPIRLRDRTEITEVTTAVTTPGSLANLLSASVDSTNDSPFTDTDTISVDTNSPSPDTPSPDSPSPETPSPDTPSPDTPSPDTPSPDSDSASLDSSVDS